MLGAPQTEDSECKRIFIVGAGIVGGALGMALLDAGHTVTFVDILRARVEQLRAAGLDAADDLHLDQRRGAYIFLTVPTPVASDRYDLTALRAAAASVGRALSRSDAHHVVAVRSTVPPGTTEGLVAPALQEASGKRCGTDFGLASVPEFLRAASADIDARKPWMTVNGARADDVRDRLARLLVPFGGQLRLFDNPTTAETIKSVHNLFNATKISFWNEIWQVCNALGIEPDEVATTVAASAEASFNPLYGIRGGAAFAGPCLPKDVAGFLGFGDDHGIPLVLATAAMQVNHAMTRVAGPRVTSVGAGIGTQARSGALRVQS